MASDGVSRPAAVYVGGDSGIDPADLEGDMPPSPSPSDEVEPFPTSGLQTKTATGVTRFQVRQSALFFSPKPAFFCSVPQRYNYRDCGIAELAVTEKYRGERQGKGPRALIIVAKEHKHASFFPLFSSVFSSVFFYETFLTLHAEGAQRHNGLGRERGRAEELGERERKLES